MDYENIRTNKYISKLDLYLIQTRNLALLATLVMTISIFISWSFYPWSYSIKTNWISNLGSYFLNPQGAIFINIGFVFTGIIIGVIFLKGNDWLINFLGVILAFALISVGLQPQENLIGHSIFADIFFKVTLVVIILMCISMKNKPLKYFGFIAIVLNLYFLFWDFVPFLEWVTFVVNFSFILSSAFNNVNFRKV